MGVLVALNMDSPRWDCCGTSKETQPHYLTRAWNWTLIHGSPWDIRISFESTIQARPVLSHMDVLVT